MVCLMSVPKDQTTVKMLLKYILVCTCNTKGVDKEVLSALPNVLEYIQLYDTLSSSTFRQFFL